MRLFRGMNNFQKYANSVESSREKEVADGNRSCHGETD